MDYAAEPSEPAPSRRESRDTRLYHLLMVRHGWYGRIFHSQAFHRLVDSLSRGEP